MNIVKLFRGISGSFNEENKCGFCWEFSAPMWEDQSNIIQMDNPCCVQLRLINYSENTVRQYITATGVEQSMYTDFRFTLQMLKQSNIGTNIDNEIKGYDLESSRWEEIYYPLKECWSDSNFIKWCELLGLQVEIQSWNFTMVKNYMDMSFDGWNLNISIRIKDYQYNKNLS